MKVAVYQIADAGDPDLNIAKAYDKIITTEADFFALPEFFTMPGGDNRRPYTLQSALELTALPALEMFKKASTIFPGYIIGGSVVEREGDCYYNTCYVYKGGEQITEYRKINITHEEVELNLCRGKEPVKFETPFGTVGLMICADCISWDVVDATCAGAKLVFLPVSLTDPNHPPFTGHPVSDIIAKKYGSTVIKITRVGTFGGKILSSRSAITNPAGTLWEAPDAQEYFEVVEVP
jgi:deaminated glutathione amidase